MAAVARCVRKAETYAPGSDSGAADPFPSEKKSASVVWPAKNRTTPKMPRPAEAPTVNKVRPVAAASKARATLGLCVRARASRIHPSLRSSRA